MAINQQAPSTAIVCLIVYDRDLCKVCRVALNLLMLITNRVKADTLYEVTKRNVSALQYMVPATPGGTMFHLLRDIQGNLTSNFVKQNRASDAAMFMIR